MFFMSLFLCNVMTSDTCPSYLDFRPFSYFFRPIVSKKRIEAVCCKENAISLANIWLDKCCKIQQLAHSTCYVAMYGRDTLEQAPR